MDTIEYRTFEKSGWGPGPWQDEPDKKQWMDPATGLPCLIVRNRSGAWCGYVGVDEEHPWYKKGYSECTASCNEDWCHHTPEALLDVHGGITFADMCQPNADPEKHICHVSGKGEPDHVWWFGFDCSHWNDMVPAYGRGEFTAITRCGTYRDMAYVVAQVTRLAAQLIVIPKRP